MSLCSQQLELSGRSFVEKCVQEFGSIRNKGLLRLSLGCSKARVVVNSVIGSLYT